MMSRAERTVNLIGVVVPFVGLIAAVVLLWNQWVDWIDLTIMAVTYLAFGLGITVGYHRLLTHRSFRTHKPTEYTFAVLGSMALVWNTLMERPTESIAGLGLVAMGLPFYWYWSKSKRPV